MELPHLNGTSCAKVDVEMKKNDEAHIKHQKARHNEQHCQTTAKPPPLLRTEKGFDFLPPKWHSLRGLPLHFYVHVNWQCDI
jgi:hypothetical protein